MSEEEFTITVKIDARKIRLDIPRAEEQTYRDAAKELDDYISFYKKKYAEADYELILKMAAYHMSVKAFTEKNRKNVHPLVEKIEELNSKLDNYIKGSAE